MKSKLYRSKEAFTGLCICFLLLSFSTVYSQNYVLNGDAVDLGGNCYQLTPQDFSKRGSVWYQNKLNLAFDFKIEADLNFGVLDGNGADGIAFVLQPVCNGIGAVGGGIGFAGIAPSLAVEFDTWQNNVAPEDFMDPVEDHIALQKDGNLLHTSPLNLVGPVLMPNLEDGSDHTAIFTWNASALTFSVVFDGNPVITFTGNIVNDIFSGNSEVFWGFTAATGAAINNQTVCITNVDFEELIPYATTNAGCPNSSDGAIDLMLTGGVGPFTYLWSNGATTEDLSGLPAGDYTVMVTDANGCVSTYTITVSADPDTIPPVIICPADISVSTDPGICGAVVSYALPGVTDDCPSPTLALTTGLGSGVLFPEGITTETYTTTDAGGNTATCSFTVTVTDTEAPALTCPPDLTIACNSPDDPSVTGSPAATDNCDPAPATSYSDVVVSGDCNWECLIERTWTATDLNGNSSTCLQLITKSVLPLIQDALSVDVTGDGLPDPIVLGTSRHTVSIGYDAAACVVGWIPGDAAAPAAAIPLRGNHVVDPVACQPGPVAITGAGRLADPLMEYALILAIKLRLDPDFGNMPISVFTDCTFHPIVFQYMKNNPKVKDLMLLANNALGNIIGPPHLEHIKNALACINGTYNLCDPAGVRPANESFDGVQNLALQPEQEKQDIRLFPNPASWTIFLDSPQDYGKPVKIGIYGAQGIRVKEIISGELPSGPFTIDLEGQPAGLYWFELQSEGQPLRTGKFVVNRL